MKKESLQKLGHLIAGLLTLVHGFEEFEAGALGSAAGYFIFSIGFLVIAGAHKTMLKKFMQGDVAFFLLEAVIILYSGWHYKAKGQTFLYYTMAGSGFCYILFAMLSINIDSNPRRKRFRRKSEGRPRTSRSIKEEEFLQSTRRPESDKKSPD